MKDLGGIANPESSMIKMKSYVNVDQFYHRNILENGLIDRGKDEFKVIKRYNNYPWAASSVQIAHDFSKKSVNSPKLLRLKAVRQREVLRQHKVSNSLFGGHSSRNLIKGLPPIRKHS